MSIEWSNDLLVNGQCQHTLVFQGDNSQIKDGLIACADKAFSMFDESVLDTSMFCIFEWCAESKSFSIVVTDSTKQEETKNKVSVVIAGENVVFDAGFVDDVQAVIRDYLTTCLPFLQYSLIAVFSEGDRARTVML
jgi:hypothetical protein